MKSIEQLKQLAKNPYYQMPEDEKALLDSEVVPAVDDNSKKKLVNGIVTVKETGYVSKHPSDPITDRG